MSALSRRKGTKGEQDVARLYREHGFPAARVPNSGGLDTKGDVLGIPGIHCEVKCAGRISILEWLAQAEGEAPAGQAPTVHFRLSSRQRSTGWYVALPLADFIALLPKPPDAPSPLRKSAEKALRACEGAVAHVTTPRAP
jgi:hypothetical protein